MPGNESVGLKYQPIYDFSGGMVTNYNFTRVQRHQSKKILNGVLTTDGCVEKRRGRVKLNADPISGNPVINSLHLLGQVTNADLIFAGADNGTLNEVSTGTAVLIKSGLTVSTYLSATAIDNFLFFVNGADKPFMTKGAMATTYDIGIPAVTAVQFAGFTVTPAAGGDGTNGLHQLSMRYRSTITGARSNPYIVGEAIQVTTVTLGGGNNTYRVNIAAAAVSSDPQVDFIDIFVQEAGVTDPNFPFYFLGTVPNAIGSTNFGTDVSDQLLGLLEVLDIDDYQPEVTSRDIETWRGRLLAIIDDYHVRYSKFRFDANTAVNLPTSWPKGNDLEVGFGDGDPLVKIVIFNDYVLAFKRRSVWILLGNFDSPGFGFKRLKTNYANIGLINQKSISQAGERIFFVSDDLKFYYFSVTDFSTEELRVKSPPVSEDIGNLFTTIVTPFRDFVNVSDFNFSQHTEVLINFSDGSSGLTASENFNSFVYDYTVNNGQGGWTIFSGIEAASSILARDSDRNYYVYSGDYFGFVWKNAQSDGDGAEINGTSTGGNYNQLNHGAVVGGPFLAGETVVGSVSQAQGVVTFVGVGFIRVTNVDNVTPANFAAGDVLTGGTSGATATMSSGSGVLADTTKTFTSDLIGVFASIILGTGSDQVKRITAIVSPTVLGFNTTWSFVPDNTSEYTVGGIDFQVWGRDDWCDEEAPPDFDKYGWYVDLDIEGSGVSDFTSTGVLTVTVDLVKDRSNVVSVSRDLFLASSSLWGFAHWGFDVWGGSTGNYLTVGFDLLFRQLSVRVINRLAGQFIKLNGWTICYQDLEHIRSDKTSH